MHTSQDDADLTAKVASAAGNRSASLAGKRPSKNPCDHLQDYPLQPTTQFGLKSGNYSLTATGSFTCYADSQYESGALHTVLLGIDAPLQPSTTSFYRAGDPELGWSAEQSFLTAPPVGPSSVPYK